MFKEIIVTFLLSGSIGAKSLPVTIPVHTYKESAVVNDTLTLYGNYNFQNVIGDVTSFDDDVYEIVFEDITTSGAQNKELVPIHRSSSTLIYYCDKITFVKDDFHVDVTFHVYNHAYASGVDWVYSLDSDDDISTLVQSNYDLIFEVRQQYLIHDDLAYIFDALFTTYDNVYTRSYTGYYNFRNGLTNIPTYFVAFGYFMFNQSSYSLMFNYGDGIHTDTHYAIYLSYYQLIDLEGNGYQGYSIESFGLPFNSNSVISSNIYMTGVKMTNTTYNRLSNVGVFGYVRDTSYDDVTFRDFFFSLVDTPIYFASSLLSFELFGVNLFIALTGLLTLCCILLLIKKFW